MMWPGSVHGKHAASQFHDHRDKCRLLADKRSDASWLMLSLCVIYRTQGSIVLITLPIFLYNFHKVPKTNTDRVCKPRSASVSGMTRNIEQDWKGVHHFALSASACCGERPAQRCVAATAGVQDAVQRDAACASRDGCRRAKGSCGPSHVHTASAAIRQCRCVI